LALYYWRFNKAQRQINLLLRGERRQLETENSDLIFQREDLLKLNKELEGEYISISLSSSTETSTSSGNKIHFVDPSEITYISAEDKGVYI